MILEHTPSCDRKYYCELAGWPHVYFHIFVSSFLFLFASFLDLISLPKSNLYFEALT